MHYGLTRNIVLSKTLSLKKNVFFKNFEEDFIYQNLLNWTISKSIINILGEVFLRLPSFIGFSHIKYGGDSVQ